MKEKTIAVVGGGSWATAIVKILFEHSEIKVNWYIRKPEHVAYIKKFKHNPAYLSDVEINLNIVEPSSDLNAVLAAAEIVIIATPAAFVKELLKHANLEGKMIVSAVKGMIPEENLLISNYLQKFHRVSPHAVSMVAGPCHSEEVAMERQSYLTIAANKEETAKAIAELFSCRFIKATSTTDLYGVEYAAVLKNIYGIACGLARGLNYGDNFQAVLVANSLKEMKYILNHYYPSERDITASAYLGDLLVTAYSQFSRNRTLGNMVGRGYSAKTALMEMNMVSEGYYGVKCVHAINLEAGVEMPIVKAVYNILYEKIAPGIEFKILENRFC